MEEFRDFEKLTSGKWETAVFDNLEPGDIFRATDDPGHVVRAISHPKRVPDADGGFLGNMGVRVEPVSAEELKCIVRGAQATREAGRRMKLRDRWGYPVLTIRGRRVLNFFRYLLHTDIVQTWKRRKERTA